MPKRTDGLKRRGVHLDLPYLWAPKIRGKRYFYYRRKGQRVPISDEAGKRLIPADPGFFAAYERIHESFQIPGTTEAMPGTLAHAIKVYRASPEFRGLAAASKSDYERYLDKLARSYGDRALRDMPQDVVLIIRDGGQQTPSATNYLIAVLRRVLSFAAGRKKTFLLPSHWINPALGVKPLRASGEHKPWPDNLILDFRRGAYSELRWLMEGALWTGQRRSDLLKMAWGHLEGGGIKVHQQKTQELLWIPCHSEFAKVLAEIPKRQTVIFTTRTGRPWTSNRISQEVAKQVKKLGFAGYSLHGLRYNAAQKLFEVGCTPQEAQAITGHATLKMVQKYGKGASQKRLAKAAIAKLERGGNGIDNGSGGK